MRALSWDLHIVNFNVLLARKITTTFESAFASSFLLPSNWFEELFQHFQLVKPFVKSVGLKRLQVLGAHLTGFVICLGPTSCLAFLVASSVMTALIITSNVLFFGVLWPTILGLRKILLFIPGCALFPPLTLNCGGLL